MPIESVGGTIRSRTVRAVTSFDLRLTRRTTGSALAIVVLAVTGACGDDDDAPLAASQTSDSAVTELPAERDEDQSTATTGSSAGAVIELADLPAGWQETPVEALENDSAGSCLNVLVGEGGPFDMSDERTSAQAFAQSSLGAFLMAASVESVGDSADVLAGVEQLILSCDGETDAAGFTTSITPALAPEAGDGGVSFHGAAENDRGARISFLIASARAGDAVMLAMHVVALGELDEQLVGDVLRTMADRAE